MDNGGDLINISKIKDSLFIGDKISGTNLDVLIQFKITHIINCAGLQILNYYESIGIQYLTLDWSENPNQILFDQNDEVVDKILNFVKEALTKGEGLLIYSVKGKNRCCVAVVMYLMKKYHWSVKKSIDFIKSKKEDIKIEQYFIEQLLNYENRLSKITNIKTTNWNEITFNNNDENLLRNTYVNGVPIKNWDSLGLKVDNKNIIKEKKNENKNNNKHIKWEENSHLVNYNYEKELLFQDEIKNITCHMTLKPKKSSVKSEVKVINEPCLSKSASLDKKNIARNKRSNNSTNPNKKKLKIRPDVDLDKLSSEYTNISPNILKQIIENDSFCFFDFTKNNTNNNLYTYNVQNPKSKRPSSCDNKNKMKKKKNNEKLKKNVKNLQNNKEIGINHFKREQKKIKNLIENNKFDKDEKDDKLITSLNKINSIKTLINNYVCVNNNYFNSTSQFRNLYNNYPKNNINKSNNSNSLSYSMKRSNVEINNKNQNNKSKYNYLINYL